ncbi:lipopolysaccharide export system protein LptA [Endobacter medicaginis]|uniref:Lipopolysaccharide export system protein LptA n=3 Tax=Endobacter medicaginis TaxID=1181271 RepID=A0A839UVW4_9PROT|nr:hypothetical protein [Endobacter medicaginis]MBB3172795.1 lipopolysaccharide export system protein LptA [Endobacter medicaginis]MCX5474402.1 hypothetical protein [Endobacter medicaginis]
MILSRSPVALALVATGWVALAPVRCARAQQIDLSHGGQITVSSAGGMQLDQHAQTVTFFNQAQATRGNVTVTADLLRAYYRKKPEAAGPAGTHPTKEAATGAMMGALPATSAPGQPQAAVKTQLQPAPGPASPSPASPNPASPGGIASGGLPGTAPLATPATHISDNPGGDDAGSNEIYRLEAIGHVHIFTATDQAFGDHAIYDMDRAVMIMTGHDLRLITPQDLMTARDSMEYYPNTRMSVGRGDASVTTSDGRRISADVLVGYSDAPDQKQPAKTPADPNTQGQDPLASSGKLRRADAFGHVVVRTATETITGDKGVYTPASSVARIAGNVHITRGQNQLNGAAAVINMKTGIATMTQAPGGRVEGLVVPNDNTGGGQGISNGAAPAGKGRSK